MSLRSRRIDSSMTAEAKALAEKRLREGKDPVTGKNEGGKTAPCPRCEVKQPAQAPDKKPGGFSGSGGPGKGGGEAA
jgi:hypothetical protein